MPMQQCLQHIGFVLIINMIVRNKLKALPWVYTKYLTVNFILHTVHI